jgi:ketosteroid isomerase-like protein
MSTATLQAHATQPTTAKDEADILAVIEKLHQAHHDKDAAEIAAAHARDAAIFNLAPPLVHHGIDVKEKQAWLDSWETRIDLEPRDLEITVSGNFAYCHCFLRMSGTKKGPEGTVSFWMRETLCFQRQSSGWRIVHEHTSVPFYMDGSLRAAFDLQP